MCNLLKCSTWFKLLGILTEKKNQRWAIFQSKKKRPNLIAYQNVSYFFLCWFSQVDGKSLTTERDCKKVRIAFRCAFFSSCCVFFFFFFFFCCINILKTDNKPKAIGRKRSENCMCHLLIVPGLRTLSNCMFAGLYIDELI